MARTSGPLSSLEGAPALDLQRPDWRQVRLFRVDQSGQHGAECKAQQLVIRERAAPQQLDISRLSQVLLHCGLSVSKQALHPVLAWESPAGIYTNKQIYPRQPRVFYRPDGRPWLSLCHHHLDELLVIDLAIAIDICLPNHLIHLQRHSTRRPESSVSS